ncbi:hypothetical protein ACFPVX_23650 [Cohnella faecalis]|uniref:Uncharacterized protein n=1 Tax=Cohnella faecalis TaxID=2315694 RepID=A0A398CJ65_9BACL|nr:hypothetical protein [Cohnella faecalis]RIE02152.1 hypothetical protein D3H35_15500 [Cohnella faecalis]
MNPKQWLLSSTMAVAIAIGSSTTWSDDAKASPLTSKEAKLPTTISNIAAPTQDHLLHLLGATEDELYDALYNEKSLAELAASKQVEVSQIIELQVAEMTEQLEARLSSGSLSPAAYEAQKSELTEIITNSVYGGSQG